MFSPLLEDQHQFYIEICCFQQVRRLHNVADCIVVVNAPDLLALWVRVDGDETRQSTHEQQSVDELEQVNCIFWVIIDTRHLNQRLDGEVS